MMKKTLFILLGVISMFLGIVGIFVPGLPTTPFILLSSWLFYKSSRRLHDWLHRSSLGIYIRRYEEQRGMSRGAKIFSIASMWTMIMVSSFVFLEDWPVRILLFVLGAVGSFVVAFIVPGARKG